MVLSLAKALDSLACACSLFIYKLADGSGADKCDTLDIGAFKNRVDLVSRTGDNVDNAVGNACFLIKLGNSESRSRSKARCLENHRVAACNTGRSHPAERNHSREVYRNDTCENAHRLAVLNCVVAS